MRRENKQVIINFEDEDHAYRFMEFFEEIGKQDFFTWEHEMYNDATLSEAEFDGHYYIIDIREAV